MRQFILMLIAPFVIACGLSCQQKAQKSNSLFLHPHYSDTQIDSFRTLLRSAGSARDLTPVAFLEAIKLPLSDTARGIVHSIQVEDDFPGNYVTRKDVERLLYQYIDSDSPCYCIINTAGGMESKSQADLGGYAIALINSYRYKTRLSFSGSGCPVRTDSAVADIRDWWNRENGFFEYSREEKSLRADSSTLALFWAYLQEAEKEKDVQKLAKLIQFPMYCSTCEPDSLVDPPPQYPVIITRDLFERSYYREFFRDSLREPILKGSGKYGESLTLFYDERHRARGVQLVFTNVAPSKNWEGSQGYLLIRRIGKQFKIVGIDQLP